MAAAAASQGSFERLTEDEVAFCWRSLADQGQLSVQRLQQFMQEVCGEELSVVQAKDLLNYMDANGDGRVGMEDFRHFVSIGRLADTDPKSFMWAPKAKYRKEHGLDKHQEDHKTPDHVHRSEGQQSQAGGSTLSEWSRRFSLESLGESAMEEAQPQRLQRAGPLEPVGELTSVDEKRPTRILPHSPHETPSQNAQTPTPMVQAPLRNRSSRGGRRTSHSQLAHHRPSVLGADAAGRSRPNTVSLTPEPPQHRQAGAATEPPASAPEVPRARPPRVAQDPKSLKKIENALERHEQATWALLLREEAEAKRRIFAQFAAETEPWELSAHEFHKMLMRWQELARWQLPGDIRPGDSLAAIEYFMRRDRESRGPPADAEAEDGAQPAAEATTAVEREAKVTYQLWLDILAGKHRPEEHLASAQAGHAENKYASEGRVARA